MLSPGVAQGCFELLAIVCRSNLQLRVLKNSFPTLGSIPIDLVLRAAFALRWLSLEEDGCVRTTDAGMRILEVPSYPYRLRRALHDLVRLERPPWIQNAISGRARVLAYASAEIAQTIVEAELVAREGPDEVAFWDSLGAIARGEQDKRYLEIGREGERLTIAYEQARTGHSPKWIAIDSNDDGYDVLSVLSSVDSNSLAIEVKASTLGFSGAAVLSRNEWEQSKEFRNHCFHLWNLQSEEVPQLAVLSRGQIEVHVPLDSGRGRWSELKIPFSAFQSSFVEWRA